MTLKDATEKGRSITLDDLRSIDREFITPVIAANILGCDPHYIRLTAREAPEELGYNVTRIGRNTKIPRIGFIRFLEGGAGYENRVGDRAADRGDGHEPPRVGRQEAGQRGGDQREKYGQALAGRACQAGPGAVF